MVRWRARPVHWLLLGIVLSAAIAAVLGWRSSAHTPVIHIGINSWTGYDPLILAEARQGANPPVRIDLRRYPSTVTEMQAMKDGLLQGAGFTLDEAFSLAASWRPIKIVLIMDYSVGGDMIVGQRHIHNMRDLRGKRVGYEGTLVGEFLLRRALQLNFIRPSDVTLVNVNASDWLRVFHEATIDALVCFNPMANRLLHEENGNLLFSSSQIPHEIIDVLAFTEAFFEANPKAVRELARAWFESLDYQRRHPQQAAGMIAARKGITPDDYLLGLSGLVAPDLEENRRMLDLASEKNLFKYSQHIIDFMLEKGLLSARLNTLEIFDASTVNALAQP